MAIMLGYVKDGVVYMATDTRVNVDDRVHQRVAESDYKIKRLENGMLMGILARDDELVAQVGAHGELFTLDKHGCLTKEHIVRHIVPRLFRFMKERGYLANDKGEEPYFRGGILLAHEGKLYEICASFSVIAYERYQVLGAVDDLALYGMATMDKRKDVNEQLLGILQSVAKRSHLVGAPYLFIDSKDKEYRLMGVNA